MKMKPWRVALLILAVAALAWRYRPVPLKIPTSKQFEAAFPGDTQQILERSEKLTLLSLDSRSVVIEGFYTGKSGFHGYRVQGRTLLNKGDKARLLAALYDGIARGTWRAACFSPGHGIRAVHGKQVVDLVICFGCRQIYLFDEAHQTSVKPSSRGENFC